MNPGRLTVIGLVLVFSTMVSSKPTEAEDKALNEAFSDAALEEYLRLDAKPLSELYALADTSKDGLLTPEELADFEINVHKTPYIAGLTREEVLGGIHDLLKSCDQNGDGKFNLPEFEKCM